MVDEWVKDQVNTITFVMVDTQGAEVSGLGTGLTMQISKNGGAFSAVAGTQTELGSGWYKYVATTGEADTEGPVSIIATGAGCAQQNLQYYVKESPGSIVWTYAGRTLSESVLSTLSTTAERTVQRRGDTWSFTISGIGSLVGYTTIDFMIKDDVSDADTSAVVWVRKNASGLNDGLLYLNKALIASPVVSTDGSISIDDQDSGDITITVKPAATRLIEPKSRGYDVQTIISGAVNTPSEGTFIVKGDITRAVS